MKRNFKARLLSFAACLSAFLILSCGDVEESNEEKAAEKIQLESGKTLVSVSAGVQSSTRTALPDYATTDFSYVLTGKLGEAESTTIASWETFNAMVSSATEIAVGEWNFTLTATKGNTVYEGSRTKNVVAGQNNELDFSLKLKTVDATSPGSIEVKVTYPASEAKVAKVTLKRNGATVTGVTFAQTSQTRTVGATTYVDYTASYSNVSGGDYKIEFSFFEDEAKQILLGSFTESAIVASGKTSKSDITLSSLNSSYSITYKYNSGEEGVQDEILSGTGWVTEFSRFSVVTLPTPVKEGFTFGGWYADNAPALTAGTSNINGFSQGTIGDKVYYAKFIPNAELAEINHVTISGSKKVGEELTAIPYTSETESDNTKFTGKITAYVWSVSDDGSSWTSVGTNNNTYTPTQDDFGTGETGKHIKVEIIRAYSVTENSGSYHTVTNNTTAISSVATNQILKGDLSASWAVEGLSYNDVPAIGTALDATKLTATSGLSGETGAVKKTTVANANNSTVNVEAVLAFETNATVPTTSGAVPVVLKAQGYNDLTETHTVTITVKAVAPTSDAVNGLLVTEGDGESNPYTITKNWIRFSETRYNGHDIEYYVGTENTVPVDALWLSPTTADDIDVDGKKLFVRVKAYTDVAASDSTEVSVDSSKVGKLVRVTSLAISSSLLESGSSVYRFGQTITVTPKASDGSTVSDSSIAYEWYKGVNVGTADESWNSVALSITGNTYTINDKTLVDNENYIRVKATQSVTIGETTKTYTTDFVVSGKILPGVLTSTNTALVYNDGTAVVVGDALRVALISVSGDSTATASDVVAIDANLSGVSVPVAFSFGKYNDDGTKITNLLVPDQGGTLDILASADGYADLALTATISVKAAKPTTDSLKSWLVKGATALSNVTQGYVKWTQEAVDERVQWATSTGTTAQWNSVESAEEFISSASAIYLRIGAGAGVEASDATENFKSEIFKDTYLGTRHLTVSISGNSNQEIKLEKTSDLVLKATVNPNGTTASTTTIEGWWISNPADDTNIASSVGSVSDDKTTFTFKPTGVTPGTYNVTVTGKRGSVILTSTYSITIGMSN